jgi:hypothetical protein
MAATPVRYSSDVEKPVENEEQVHRDLIGTMRSITGTPSEHHDARCGGRRHGVKGSEGARA